MISPLVAATTSIPSALVGLVVCVCGRSFARRASSFRVSPIRFHCVRANRFLASRRCRRHIVIVSQEHAAQNTRRLRKILTETYFRRSREGATRCRRRRRQQLKRRESELLLRRPASLNRVTVDFMISRARANQRRTQTRLTYYVLRLRSFAAGRRRGAKENGNWIIKKLFLRKRGACWRHERR